MKKNVYVVLSQTGTLLARVIRLFTHGQYSHASVCLEDDFKTLYSFGRLNCYNPFFGGYVKESPDFGTFKRFRNTQVSIFRIEVDEKCYNALKKYLETMYENRKSYTYNYLGLILAIFNRPFKRQNSYYCSEFVGNLLSDFSVVDGNCFGEIIRPMDLCELPNSYIVYTGFLSVFASQAL